MGLLTISKPESRAAVTAENVSIGDPALVDIFGSRSSTMSGQAVTPDSSLRVSAVFACVDVLSQTLGMLPITVKKIRTDGGYDILKNHRLYKWLRNKPNRWQTSFEFFRMMEISKNLRGNAYARILSYPGRGVNELIPMNPDRVWPFIITPDKTTYFMSDNSPCPPAGSKLYYQYFPINGPTEILLSEEVHHVRGFTTNGIIGMSPITRVAREAIGLAMATEQTGAQFFGNGAKTSTAIKYPGRVDDITYDRMKKEMQEKLSGNNAFRPFMMEEGLDIVNLQMTMLDAQFLENRKFQVEDIARIFHVPLVMIGHGDKAPTYASAEQFFMSFKVNTMLPNVVNHEEALERDLLYPSEIGNIKIDMDLDSLMRGDATARANYLQKRFTTSSITPDEIRLYEGENPSNQEGSDKLYIQSSYVPLANAGIKQPAPPATGVDNG